MLYSRSSYIPTLMLLIALAAIGGLVITPGMPAIQKTFQLSHATTELILSLYLLCYAIGTLFYGPLSNRFGRRKALFIGLTIGLLGALLSALSGPLHNFSLLLVGRIFTALGLSSGYALTFVVLAELYKENFKQKMPWIALGVSIYPFSSSVVGGLLVDHLGWHSPFYFLILVVILSLYLVKSLPETATTLQPNALQPKKILTDYLTILKTPQLYFYALISACGVGAMYCFGGVSPFLVIDTMHQTATTFGLLNFLLPVAFVIGSWLNHTLANSPPLKVIKSGACLALVGILVTLIFFLEGIVNIWTLFLPFMLFFLGMVPVWSTAVGQAIRWNENKAHASSVMSFFNIAFGFITLSLISLFPLQDPLVLPLFLLILFIVIFGSLLIIRLKRYF